MYQSEKDYNSISGSLDLPKGASVMSIQYLEKEKIFTLHTLNSSYQMQVDKNGYLLHLYYGKRTSGNMDYLLFYSDRGFSGNPYIAGRDKTYSMDTLPQEYPTLGTGDYRNPALILRNPDGSFACALHYESHRIIQGKYSLNGLPAVYAGKDEAQTLEIRMTDPDTGVKVDLLYGVIPSLDIITRAAKISYEGKGTIHLEKVQASCLDFVGGDYDLISFNGRHAMERNFQRTGIGHSCQVIGSRRGMSSHQYNPMIIVADRETTEDAGSCYAMSFVYSGGFKAEAEKDQTGGTRVLMGLMDDLFSYPLTRGRTFLCPEVIMSYSGEGLSRLSHNLHKCIRRHVCRGPYRDGVRPILLNSWEGCYFDFKGEDIYRLAVEAKDLGIDLIVMDDGWFGKRDDDFAGLGDWFVNEDKLGESLGHLVKRITDLGIKFGIWFEPECISEDSDLYRAHPDWVLRIPGRDPVLSRYQLILDFSRKEVVDHIFNAVCNVLDQGDISYVKWDFNRSIADVYSHDTEDQGKVLYDYVLGLYDFFERLLDRYPDLLLEGCSGGGGRFDAGMLYYAPQIWCSDNTDAIDRLRIQYGTSFGYPVSAVGSHVSAVPNHQTGRITPLATRGTVAMAGTFGYELDPALMSVEEKEEVREQILDYRRFRDLIHDGLYYRLTNPFRDETAAWMFVSEDGSRALVSAVMQNIHGASLPTYLRLKGLKPGALYQEEKSGRIYPAEGLMEAGYLLPVEMGSYNAYRIYFKEYDGKK